MSAQDHYICISHNVSPPQVTPDCNYTMLGLKLSPQLQAQCLACGLCSMAPRSKLAPVLVQEGPPVCQDAFLFLTLFYLVCTCSTHHTPLLWFSVDLHWHFVHHYPCSPAPSMAPKDTLRNPARIKQRCQERGTGLWGTERLTVEMAKLGHDIETYWLETEISRCEAQRNQTNSPQSWDLRQLERRAENEAAGIYGNLS